MRRTPGSLIFGLAAILFLGVVGGAMIASEHQLPPCPTEDATNCHWDAAHQGNGHGRSFDSIQGRITYK